MGGLNQLKYEKPIKNNEHQWTSMKNEWKTIVLRVYGRPKPAKIWKTNEQSMKINENQWKTNEKQLF